MAKLAGRRPDRSTIPMTSSEAANVKRIKKAIAWPEELVRGVIRGKNLPNARPYAERLALAKNCVKKNREILAIVLDSIATREPR